MGALTSSPRPLAAFLVVLLAVVPTAASGQEIPPDPGRTSAVRVFLDCTVCDENFIRTEVTFVNYVRDRTAADVHVLVTTQGTGGGGIRYTLQFIGLGRFAGEDQTLTYTAPQTATADERRRGFSSMFKLGLVRYVADSAVASRLKLTFDAPANQEKAGAVVDPWNFWVFRVGGSARFEGQESSREYRQSASFSANRTTESWKVNWNGFGRYGEERFDLDEEEEFSAVSRDLDSRILVVKSLDAHWSAGGTVAVASSIYRNYHLRTRIAPGIEYNVFPYSESTRRILTLFYSVGAQTASYREETIFGRMNETLFDQNLELSMGLRQPWGTASAAAEFQHYLNASDRYRVNGFGNLNVRLFKGFSFDVFGEVAHRRDQFSLRRGEATTEEILVRQRELATGYEYEIGFGVSYSFGSIFNNVVNPRFRNVGGF